MTDYAVTIVWDIDAEDAPESVEGAATAVSHGRLATTVYVDAVEPLRAYEGALLALSASMGEARPYGVAIEPVAEDARPHFMFGGMGR